MRRLRHSCITFVQDKHDHVWYLNFAISMVRLWKRGSHIGNPLPLWGPFDVYNRYQVFCNRLFRLEGPEMRRKQRTGTACIAQELKTEMHEGLRPHIEVCAEDLARKGIVSEGAIKRAKWGWASRNA